MARRRRKSSNVRTASKQVLERILSNARHLADHPEHAAPTCTGSCSLFCTFRRARRRVAKVHKRRGDPGKLKKMGERFHKLGRAYAGLLRLEAEGEGKLEYLQSVGSPRGKVPVAPWSKAPIPCHVGLQHTHDPSLRLVSVLPFVEEEDLVFATEKGLVCAHDGALPEETRAMMTDALGLEARGPELAATPGLPDEGPGEGTAVIEITWPDGSRFRKAPDQGPPNAVLALQQHMVAPSPLQHLGVHVHVPALVDPQGPTRDGERVDLPEPVLRRYLRGELDDAG
ncbi:MAG: hypothetical protein R3185_08125, partial [Candidatus Thermoplasmatota archaeon]|nr:hypothetical protein [Candidatus Thermoplasmatota archaeon]